MGNMSGKLRFRWTSPFWITKEYNGSYQLGTLAGELLCKWLNGFHLKPYKGQVPENPFKEDENPQSTENRSEGGNRTGGTGYYRKIRYRKYRIHMYIYKEKKKEKEEEEG